MKIYLDTCCWSREYDDHTITQNRVEAAAIMKIVTTARRRGFTVLGSVALNDEIGNIPDAEKLVWVTNLYKGAVTVSVNYNKDVFRVWRPLAEAAGIKGWDIYHLCYAESAGADYLLTVDNDFLKNAPKLNTNVRVMNPLTFIQEGLI